MNKKSITTLLVFSVLLATSQIHASTIPDITLCKAENDPTRYKKRSYNHWIDEDGNGLDTRAEVLRKEVVNSVIVEEKRGRKKIVAGAWYDHYTGSYIKNPNKIDISHLVPLKEAHNSGAWDWSEERKKEYANDLENEATLIAVSKKANNKKGFKDPARWLPPNEEYHCQYIQDWIKIKEEWQLCYDGLEALAVKRIYQTCLNTNKLK